MSQQNLENEPFLWDEQLFAILSNENSDDSDDDKVIPTPVARAENENKNKRGRGASSKGKEKMGEKKEKGEIPDHELHIWTERERRKKMRNMFSILHAMLPQLPSKADKTTVIDVAVNYIKTLQGTLQRLQKQKLEKLQGGAQPKPLTIEPSVAVAGTSSLAMLTSRETFMADQVTSMNNNNNNNNSTVARINMPSFLPVAIQTWTSSNVVLNICGNDAQFSVFAPKKPGIFTSICFVLEKHRMEVVSAHISSDASRNIYMIQARLANGATEQLSEVNTMEEIYKQAAGEIMIWVTAS